MSDLTGTLHMYDLHKPWKYKVMVVQYCGSLMDKDGSYLREEWFWDELTPPPPVSFPVILLRFRLDNGVGWGMGGVTIGLV